MSFLSKVWDKLNGRKVIVGYILSQIPGLSDSTTAGAIGDAVDAWIKAAATGQYPLVIQPTAYAIAQLLLLVGVGHKVVKKLNSPSS